MIAVMKAREKVKVAAGNVGAALIVFVLALGAAIWHGQSAGWWAERGLILATVKDASKLELGAPVFFRGVKDGKGAHAKAPCRGPARIQAAHGGGQAGVQAHPA